MFLDSDIKKIPPGFQDKNTARVHFPSAAFPSDRATAVKPHLKDSVVTSFTGKSTSTASPPSDYRPLLFAEGVTDAEFIWFGSRFMLCRVWRMRLWDSMDKGGATRGVYSLDPWRVGDPNYLEKMLRQADISRLRTMLASEGGNLQCRDAVVVQQVVQLVRCSTALILEIASRPGGPVLGGSIKPPKTSVSVSVETQSLNLPTAADLLVPPAPKSVVQPPVPEPAPATPAEPPVQQLAQASALMAAAVKGVPFCEVCSQVIQGSAASEGQVAATPPQSIVINERQDSQAGVLRRAAELGSPFCQICLQAEGAVAA